MSVCWFWGVGWGGGREGEARERGGEREQHSHNGHRLPPFSRKADGPYDSRVLPVTLALALIVMLLLVFGGAVAELVGK